MSSYCVCAVMLPDSILHFMDFLLQKYNSYGDIMTTEIVGLWRALDGKYGSDIHPMLARRSLGPQACLGL